MRRFPKREQNGQEGRVDIVPRQDFAHEGFGNVEG